MSPSLAPGHVFAGYRIDGVAGGGGQGDVYRATHITTDRAVALKLITPGREMDPASRKRFEREAAVLVSIKHPNVIEVYETGEAEGQLFMSMRYVDGYDLHRLIWESGRLAPDLAGRILTQVAAALDVAHDHDVAHRDVKPANVLIEQREGTEHVYLGDFGLMHDVNLTDGVTPTGTWVGTINYVAPEQIRGGHGDARSDVYSVACMLFEMLTGRAPYARNTDDATVNAHLNDPPPSARELRPELPVEIDRIIARGMSKDPAQRYASAGELAGAATPVLTRMTPEAVDSVHVGVLVASVLTVALCTAICIAWLPAVLRRSREGSTGCLVCSLQDYIAVGASLVVWPALVLVAGSLIASIGGLLSAGQQQHVLDTLDWLVRFVAGAAAVTFLILGAIEASSTVRVVILIGLTPLLVLSAIEGARRLRR